MLCSGRAQSGRAVTPTRNGCRRPVSGVVVGLEVFADQAWTRSFIYPTPHQPLYPLYPSTTTTTIKELLSSSTWGHHSTQVSKPPITEVRFAYHGGPCRSALSPTYTAQTWARSETSLILASMLPFRAHRRRHRSQSVMDFSMEQAELQRPFLDRPNYAA